MTSKRVLTGVTTTGIPHLGNYVGAIRPAIRASQSDNTESFLFLADYHGIIKCHDPDTIHQSTQAVAATWLACGLDPERTTFYRQSDIPEIMELNWILTCITAKGLMNRAHAYKAAVQENTRLLRDNLLRNIAEISNLSRSLEGYLKRESKDENKIKTCIRDLYSIFDDLRKYYKYDNFCNDVERGVFEGVVEFCRSPGVWYESDKEKKELSIFQENLDKLLDSLNKYADNTKALDLVDPDNNVEMGLYSYPILMSADILMFNAHEVPVGRDQIQHVEMARDIAGRFNHRFKEVFTLPEAKIDENVELLVGLDGRKMSKSYGNTIPLWETDKKTQKSVNKIITNLKEPGEPKQPDESPLFEIYKAFASPAETAEFTQMLAEGLAWGEAKKLLAAKINAELAEPRERYNALTAQPAQIEEILQAGAQRARKQARVLLNNVRDAVGIRALK